MSYVHPLMGGQESPTSCSHSPSPGTMEDRIKELEADRKTLMKFMDADRKNKCIKYVNACEELNTAKKNLEKYKEELAVLNSSSAAIERAELEERKEELQEERAKLEERASA